MRDYSKINAYVKADELALQIYKITKSFPKEEMYGLTSQMRRAAVSVPSNIVEGSSRESTLEFVRFLEIAFGSLKELNYQFSLAVRLEYVDNSFIESTNKNLDETSKMLGAYIRTVRSSFNKK